ncbi:FHA domain-containing protein [bacterium]|nr:FHA domain-containing protein [bacterium]
MANVFITLISGESTSVDLALPEDVPIQFLAKSLGKATSLRVPDGYLPTLFLINEKQKKQLPPAGTLQTAKIVNGSFLTLELERFVSKSGAYLQTSSGIAFALKKSQVIGRTSKTEVDIDLSGLDSEKAISRKHALVRQDGELFYLEDLGSRNGTWVNGERLAKGESVPLGNGNEVIFGTLEKGVKLIFHHS